MKFKLTALVLFLTVASWAQSTSTQAPAATDRSTTEIKCACCDKMASTAKAASSEHKHACIHASAKDGKETASCRARKEAASCCKGNDSKACMKTASTDCCAEKCTDMKDCCAAKESKKTAHNCCGADQCGHEHSESATSGN